ncbi:UNVERIFIED_CONTAM: hypothetical protein HDU68_000651 [Siphonaria sp. JEL0065]|nr:hypothetical protein HDU68_000651 [Siphonaria sp. JEL0065]
MIVSILAIANRAGWSFYDLATSYTFWNSDYGYCAMNSNTISLTGYLVSDMATDIICTLATVIVSVQYFASDLRKLFLVMIGENIMRSLFVLPIQIISVWCTLAQLDSSWANIIGGIEMYIVTQAVNSEWFMFWIRNSALNDAMKKDLDVEMERKETVGNGQVASERHEGTTVSSFTY